VINKPKPATTATAAQPKQKLPRRDKAIHALKIYLLENYYYKLEAWAPLPALTGENAGGGREGAGGRRAGVVPSGGGMQLP
jgi:hypothetical protein